MSRLFAIVSIAVVLVLASCSSESDSAGEDAAPEAGAPAQDGDTVDVHYIGTFDDGEQFDSSYERDVPLTVTLGTGGVMPGFEDAVLGLGVGERVTVRIEPAEAYGERDESRIVEVPYAPSQEDVAVGDIVTLNTGEQAEVLEVRSETVVLDANHPLAGQALTFEIEVVAITRG
jgi:FKBP-type peptidyl-prolyl cis-trans isomerase 2